MMCAAEKGRPNQECECFEGQAPAGRSRGQSLQESTSAPVLEDLIPIAVVIAAGCEPCAEKMVIRALERRNSEQHIRRTLGIIAHLKEQDCLAQAIGSEGVARMERSLVAGKDALSRAVRQERADRRAP